MHCPQKVRHFLGAFFMGKNNKYSYEIRLESVEAVLRYHRSVTSVASEGGFERSNLRLWIGLYREHGALGLLPRVRQQQYDSSFKLLVIQTIEKECLSLRQASARFNIASESVILQWRRSYVLHGIAGLLPKKKGRPATDMKQPNKRKPRKSDKPLTREEELLKENEYLRAENALLKKLEALAQTSKKQKP